MIIYRNTKFGFIEQVKNNIIAQQIEEAFKKNNLNNGNNREYRSWANSLQYVRNVIDDKDIDDNCEVAIEYKIPLAQKRVDFMIMGMDDNGNNNVVVIELKQWEDSKPANNPSLVETYTGGATRLVTHPSYQVYAYAKMISSFNEEVQNNNINLYPCAYLHNYRESNRNNIDNDFYKEAVSLAPVYLENDSRKLNEFIKKYIRKKDNINILFNLEEGKIKPAKALQDAVASMIKGNQEFYLLDEQKVVYEKVIEVVKQSQKDHRKYTIICQGGPGTGKSVVAIQLLADVIKSGGSANYITKNSAPREVYFEKLRQNNFKLNYVNSLFRSSGSFIDSPKDAFECLIVDEAHRLNAKSGMFQNKGFNQIKEIIHAAKVSVFFIDEKQIVTTKDIGSVQAIREFALEEGSTIIEGEDYNLVSQFRCNGSDGYLEFLDYLFDEKVCSKTFKFDYDFRIYDDPNKMREDLRAINDINNKTRMVAGYCYNWITKNCNDDELYDINLKNNFKAKWNFSNTKTWAIDKNSFDQIGCIHTSQGLEFDYVGVIIGRDLIFENNKVITDETQRAKTDQSLKGIKTTKNYLLADKIIRDTYKTLMTRGQKGCFIYCEDEELANYIVQTLNKEIIQ